MGIHMKNNINYTGATSLNTLRDVVIDSPATGQGIVWDEEKQQWTNGEVSTNDMVEITLAEYEALSTEEKNNDTTYFITDADNTNPGSIGTAGTLKPWLYDTEKEVVIGVYDGKPLYRKFFTIKVTCATNSLTAYVLSDYLSDYDNIIAYKTYIDYNTLMPLPIYIASTTGSTWSYNIALEVTNDRITVSTGSEVKFTNQDALIMVEYTKTTDAEGSGTNLMPYSFVQNGGGCNYSTEEQVIGKWIDGRDVYQKSYSVKPDVGATVLLDSTIKHLTHVLTDVRGIWAIGDFTMSNGCQASFSTSIYFDSKNVEPPSIYINEEGLYIKSNSVSYGFETYFTIQYIKTTD